MPGLASIFRRPLFRRSRLLRSTGNAGVAAMPAAESPDARLPRHVDSRAQAQVDPSPDVSPRPGRGQRTEAERLESIAMYARAGYFNLGYTHEMFHLAGELPPPE
jgi:hypothetical protein